MEEVIDTMLMIVAFALAIICHEVAHGLAALWLGDDTAKKAGRLTLDPIPHIDPIGSILLPAVLALTGTGVMFGWAKPVPVNLARMRNQRKGLWVTAIAGPLTNLILAIVGALLARLVLWRIMNSDLGDSEHALIWKGVGFLVYVVQINVLLMVFNMLPIPPLDGSRVVAAMMRPAQARTYLRFGQFGFIAIFLLMNFGALDRVIGPLFGWLTAVLLGI